MAVIKPIQEVKSLNIKNKLGTSSNFGQLTFGETRFGQFKSEYGIYQQRRKRKIKITIKTKFYLPKNPKTERQMINRLKFKEAVKKWQNLTNNEKEKYNISTKYKNLSGYNLFIKLTLLSN